MVAMLDTEIALRRRDSEDLTVEIPPPSELLDRVRALPAGAPLLERLPAEPPVYLVGGAVRDLLLKRQPLELDLVVEGDPERVTALLGGTRRVHDRFKTSSVMHDGFRYDLAQARTETYPRPGALPEVKPAGLAEDLGRRDFTVNAMALALVGERMGELTLVPNALEDLEAGLLRVLHDRSFIDDPTRLLRMARYSARLGFSVEPQTAELAREAVDAGALATVSGARVGAELRLLACEPDPVAAIGKLGELGLDTAIDPDFGLQDPALANRALALLPDDGRPDRLVLAVATARMPVPRLMALLSALAFKAVDRDIIFNAATRVDAVAAELARATRPSEIAAAADGASPELIALAGALGPASQAWDWLTQLREVQLQIDGSDLLAAGVTSGPAIGRGLRAARAAKLDGRAPDQDSELAEALRAARPSG
jgi:tRNA nucleotidyltransferase (CCA-adding enzyme)